MGEQQIYEESMKMARESLANMVQIKWALVCIALQLWGVSVYFLLKEIPKWWRSFDKKEEETIGFKFKNKNNE